MWNCCEIVKSYASLTVVLENKKKFGGCTWVEKRKSKLLHGVLIEQLNSRP